MFVYKNNKLYLTKGDTASMTIDLTDAAGLPTSVQTNDVLTLTVREKVGGTIIFTAENAVGEPSIDITPAMTKTKKAGTYSADIQLKRGSEIYTIFPDKPFEPMKNMQNFVLLPEVTET